MKCQPKQPTIPIENVSIRHILTGLTKRSIQNAELPALTVANRIRIEEFGKQEFFIHRQISPFDAPPQQGSRISDRIGPRKPRIGIVIRPGQNSIRRHALTVVLTFILPMIPQKSGQNQVQSMGNSAWYQEAKA